MAIYAGTGRTKAYVDLVNMKTDIKLLIKTLLPVLVGVGVCSQLFVALGMIWYSQGSIRPPKMQEEEPERVYEGLLYQSLPQQQQQMEGYPVAVDNIPLLPLQQRPRRRNTENGL